MVGSTPTTSPTKPRSPVALDRPGSGWRPRRRARRRAAPCTLMAATISRLTLPDEHHAGDVERLGVGHAQPVAELHRPCRAAASARRSAGRRRGPRPGAGRPSAGATMSSANVDRPPSEPSAGDAVRAARRTSRRPRSRRSAGCRAVPRRAGRRSPPPRPLGSLTTSSGSRRCSRGRGRSRARCSCRSRGPRSQTRSIRGPAMWAATAVASWSAADAVATDRHAAVGDRDHVGIEVDAGRAELAHDPSPVRVRPVDRALDEQRRRPPGGRPGAASASDRAPRTADRQHLRRPLGVGDHLLGQGPARLSHRGRQRLGLGRAGPARWPAGSPCRWWTCSRPRSSS